MPTETEFKHSLREKRKDYERLLKLLNDQNYEELRKELENEIKVINDTLAE